MLILLHSFRKSTPIKNISYFIDKLRSKSLLKDLKSILLKFTISTLSLSKMFFSFYSSISFIRAPKLSLHRLKFLGSLYWTPMVIFEVGFTFF